MKLHKRLAGLMGICILTSVPVSALPTSEKQKEQQYEMIKREGHTVTTEGSIGIGGELASSEVIDIIDNKFKTKLNEILGQKPGSNITKGQLGSITHIDFSNSNITSLEGIQYCSGLTHLDLSNNQISDISLLEDLTNLEYLDLDCNEIFDISALNNLDKLEYLLLGEQLSDYYGEVLIYNNGYEEYAEMNNVIKGINGELISPNDMPSPSGTKRRGYDEATHKIWWYGWDNHYGFFEYVAYGDIMIGKAESDFSLSVSSTNIRTIYIPHIAGVGSVSLKEGEAFNPLEGVSATDLDDGVITKDIKITGNVDTNKAGKYELIYTVTDKDGNTVTAKRIVTVNPKWIEMNTIPKINAENKTIRQGEIFDPLNGVKATDTEDGPIPLTEANVIRNEVDVNIPGIYEVEYRVTDSQGATAIKVIQVKVNPKILDINTIPEIKVTDKIIIQGKPFNPLTCIKAYDVEDGDLTDKITVESNTVDINVVGEYSVTYKVIDSQGASITKTIKVTVVPKPLEVNQTPMITAENVEIMQGSIFDPLLGVKAYDIEDGDLTSEVTIKTNTVDVNVPGEYDVTYKVVDSQGASMVKAIKVIVKPKLVILNQVPTVEMHTKEFTVGEEIRPSEYITIKDDGDISKVTVKVTSTIPYEVKNQKEYFKKAGKYKITYTVTDELGASSSQTFDIIVKEKSEPSTPNKPSEGGSSSVGINNKPKLDDFFGGGALQHIKYVEGYEDGTFKANVGITRGEFVMMLARILFEGGKLPTASAQFKDVSNTYFAKDAINYFATLGVVEGYEDETFRARQPITRAEIATIMKRISVLENVIDTYRSYKDVQIGHWAYDAIQEVAYKGYLAGYENDEFRPSASITRAEAVAGLNRIYRVPCNKEDINHKIKFKDISSGYWAYEDILKSSITHEHEEAKRH